MVVAKTFKFYDAGTKRFRSSSKQERNIRKCVQHVLHHVFFSIEIFRFTASPFRLLVFSRFTCNVQWNQVSYDPRGYQAFAGGQNNHYLTLSR